MSSIHNREFLISSKKKKGVFDVKNIYTLGTSNLKMYKFVNLIINRDIDK